MTDREPRIFHLITRLKKGGAEENLIATVTGLEKYEFTVGFGASYDQEQVDRLKRNGIETKQFPLLRHYNPVTALPALIHLTWHLRKNDYDIVHTNTTEAGIIGRIAAAFAGVPVIVHTILGVPFTEDRNLFLNKFLIVCERQASKYTDSIITIADIIKDKYLNQDIGIPKQYRTIRLGTKLERFDNPSPANDLPGDRPRIVMVGRLVNGKGHNVLLDATEMIHGDAGSICIVGEGPLRESLEKEILKRGLSDKVFLIGFRKDIPNILASSDILVLPSFREGTPRVITEAMASGLPIIATDIAGIPEQVNDGVSGYLIPTGDSKALADRLSELLSNPKLRKSMGERGKRQIESFSMDTMLDDLDSLYEDLVEDPS